MLLLRPSRRHGVGVFTTRAIPGGMRLALFAPKDWRFVRDPTGEELVLCRRFGVQEGDGFHCPKRWDRMSIGWYLNHSSRANVRIVSMEGHATRAIRANEELTVDYGSL
jgi:SET domain-containing protein